MTTHIDDTEDLFSPTSLKLLVQILQIKMHISR